MTTELLECGVDWLTCTWGPELTPQTYASIQADFQFEKEGRKGKWLNYLGMTTREAFFGSSSASSLLRLSGGSAHLYWHKYAVSALHISRLDIQATIKLNSDNPTLARQMFQSALVARMENLNYPRIKLIDGAGSGDTFTLGDRSSDAYLRIYDKEKESGEEAYKGCWRIELETKAHLAKATALRLLEVSDVPATIISFLLGHTHQYGLWPPISPNGVPMRLPSIKRSKDDEKTIAWLDSQVRPSIARLLDAGRSEDVYSALGLKANGNWGR